MIREVDTEKIDIDEFVKDINDLAEKGNSVAIRYAQHLKECISDQEKRNVLMILIKECKAQYQIGKIIEETMLRSR